MEQPSITKQDEAQPNPSNDAANLDQIKSLLKKSNLKTNNDTNMFAGLALLKSVLDNSPHLRQDQHIVYDLWTSIDQKFINRLIKTGSNPSKRDAKDMLDLAVSVLHTFAILLPESARVEPKFTDRIPVLVAALLHSSKETTELVLELLFTLVSTQQGAVAIVKVDDLSPIIEIAPTNALPLNILHYAFLNTMGRVDSTAELKKTVNDTIQSLVSSFKGTDAVTLLSFLGDFLRQADPVIIPSSPKWLQTVVSYIQKLVTSRPTPEAREAYTNVAASLLQVYLYESSKLLFTDETKGDKPFAYIFVNLLLIDIRSSIPMLLEKLNDPTYPKTSRQLASAFEIICMFIGFLVRALEDEEPMPMPPDSILKLRKGISETMSVTIEFLRDRWDASHAGAMGLHPDAISGTVETSTGTHQTLAWDSIENNADEDPLTLAAVQALGLWLLEDDNYQLRREATGLMDMFMDLYRSSSSGFQDFRSALLVTLEALVTLEEGREQLLQHGGWEILSRDLTDIVQTLSQSNAARGIETIRILLAIVDEERTETAEEWMDLITSISGWSLPDGVQSPIVRELELNVVQLCCSLLAKANPGLRRRYLHSTRAIAGIAFLLKGTIVEDDPLREDLDQVTDMLHSFTI